MLERVVRAAARAPSLLNTQPWRVTIEDRAIMVHPDPGRFLRRTDPLGRGAVVSCGALVDHLVVAARRVGLDAEVTLLPHEDFGGDDPVDGVLPGRSCCLARVTVAPGEPPTIEEVVLSAASERRQTSRTPLDDVTVDPVVVERLRRAAAGEESRFVVLPPHSTGREVALRQVARAEAMVAADERAAAEEAAWTCTAARRRDGLPPHQDYEDEHGGTSSRRMIERYGGVDVIAGHGAPLGVLTTPADRVSDWLTAGRALSQVLLTGAAHGLTASFATTVLEDDLSRQRLARALGLRDVPQMLVQLGFGNPGPRSARRALAP